MEEVRNIVSQALEARARAGIKVRQPLSGLTTGAAAASENWARELIAKEANFKKIVFDKNLKEIKIDTTITEELKEEGILRELVRQFQDIRKKEGLKPNEMAVFRMATDAAGKNFMIKHVKEFKKTISAKSVIISGSIEGGHEAKADNLIFKIKIDLPVRAVNN